MSMFQCEVCGCAENTARGVGVFYIQPKIFDWSYAPERKGKKVCSACGPSHYSDGSPTRHGGNWHGKFKRVYYPLGFFKTGPDGNLIHVTAGKVDLSKYVISDDTIDRARKNGLTPTDQWVHEKLAECKSKEEFDTDFFNNWVKPE